MKNYDVIIVGGGIVGGSIASLFANAGLEIALLEAAKVAKDHRERPIVLSHSSQAVLENGVQVWDQLDDLVEPIRFIHVSDQGNFGVTKISASEEGVPYLGYVLSAATLERAIQARVKKISTIDLYQPAIFDSLEYQEDRVIVYAKDEQHTLQIASKLVIAADGQHSSVRKHLNIKSKKIDYEQTAITCEVMLKRPHQNVAYERFTPEGPLAFLPLREQRAAVVWTVNHKHASELMKWDKASFLKALQNCFGYRLGKFVDCTMPDSSKLYSISTWQQIFPRVVLLGNAVHTLHPVGGQGLNLAFRDLAVLAEILIEALADKRDIGELALLQAYFQRREVDQKQIINLTNILVGVFSNSLLPVVAARSVGMVALDRVKCLKRSLTKRTLGLSGKVPRLVCGLSVDES